MHYATALALAVPRTSLSTRLQALEPQLEQLWELLWGQPLELLQEELWVVPPVVLHRVLLVVLVRRHQQGAAGWEGKGTASGRLRTHTCRAGSMCRQQGLCLA